MTDKGNGAALMRKQGYIVNSLKTMYNILSNSDSNRNGSFSSNGGEKLYSNITVKIRTGWDNHHNTAHRLIPDIQRLNYDIMNFNKLIMSVVSS